MMLRFVCLNGFASACFWARCCTIVAQKQGEMVIYPLSLGEILPSEYHQT